MQADDPTTCAGTLPNPLRWAYLGELFSRPRGFTATSPARFGFTLRSYVNGIYSARASLSV